MGIRLQLVPLYQNKRNSSVIVNLRKQVLVRAKKRTPVAAAEETAAFAVETK